MKGVILSEWSATWKQSCGPPPDMVGAHASPGKLPELSVGRARDKVAAHTGMSGRTLKKAAQIVEAAEKEPACARSPGSQQQE